MTSASSVCGLGPARRVQRRPRRAAGVRFREDVPRGGGRRVSPFASYGPVPPERGHPSRFGVRARADALPGGPALRGGRGLSPLAASQPGGDLRSCGRRRRGQGLVGPSRRRRGSARGGRAVVRRVPDARRRGASTVSLPVDARRTARRGGAHPRRARTATRRLRARPRVSPSMRRRHRRRPEGRPRRRPGPRAGRGDGAAIRHRRRRRHAGALRVRVANRPPGRRPFRTPEPDPNPRRERPENILGGARPRQSPPGRRRRLPRPRAVRGVPRSGLRRPAPRDHPRPSRGRLETSPRTQARARRAHGDPRTPPRRTRRPIVADGGGIAVRPGAAVRDLPALVRRTPEEPVGTSRRRPPPRGSTSPTRSTASTASTASTGRTCPPPIRSRVAPRCVSLARARCTRRRPTEATWARGARWRR